MLDIIRNKKAIPFGMALNPRLLALYSSCVL
ncbi:hypothetical protein FHS70_004390 [Flammeovirga yaeyamensis]|nr:hypothetical protein [Flammeovirga yaeyamensis]